VYFWIYFVSVTFVKHVEIIYLCISLRFPKEKTICRAAIYYV
jgi:hypothetical protein